MKEWIYWNEELWLITIYSNEKFVTIKDKNIWANNIGEYGKYYQWGNCNGFSSDDLTLSNVQVDTSSYSHDNHYYSDVFIIEHNDYSIEPNNELWWWEWSKGERKCMCEEGYHIPNKQEFEELEWMLSNLWVELKSYKFYEYLRMPLSWCINYNTGELLYWWRYGYCWASEWNEQWAYNYSIIFDNCWVSGSDKANWMPVREFKDNAVEPDLSWIILYEWH